MPPLTGVRPLAPNPIVSLIIVLGSPIILLLLRDRGQIGDLSCAGCNLYIKHPIHQHRIVRHQQTQTRQHWQILRKKLKEKIYLKVIENIT